MLCTPLPRPTSCDGHVQEESEEESSDEEMAPAAVKAKAGKASQATPMEVCDYSSLPCSIAASSLSGDTCMTQFSSR